MKYAGQPKNAPSWYRERSQSHIEAEFSKELEDLANKIESEQWFGDSEKHGRYRVDFILRDARLIIELDGHAYHSSPEQLEKDAIRQRYLTRAGYAVIRFTGREINRDSKSCVDEVHAIYKERMQREPAKYRVMYIDYRFIYQTTGKVLRFYKELYPERKLNFQPLEKIIPFAIEWLHEKSFITAFIFHSPEDGYEIEHLNGVVQEYKKGEIKISTISDDMYSLELGEHMVSYSHLFDDFLVIADDSVYIHPLLEVLPTEMTTENGHSHFGNCKLLRKGNEETAYLGTNLVKVKWQKLWYVIANSMGLNLHEI